MSDARIVQFAVAAIIAIALAFYGFNLSRTRAAMEERNKLIAEYGRAKKGFLPEPAHVIPNNTFVHPGALPEPVASTPVVIPAPARTEPALHSPGTFAGKWAGRGNLGGTSHAACDFMLEMREEDGGKLTAYPAVTCLDLTPLYQPTNGVNPAFAFQKSNPASAVLLGQWQEGSVPFHLGTNTGSDGSGCSIASLEATPFGSSQLAVSWKYSGCGTPGGQMLLSKIHLAGEPQ